MLRGQISILVLLFLLVACSPARLIAPLEKGEQRLSAAVGGPLLNGALVPVIPLGSLAYARGLGNEFSASGGLNISALIFKSIYIDPAIHWATAENNERPQLPRLGLRVTGHSLWSLRDGAFAFYPEITPYVFFKNEKRSIYLGVENWIDLRASSLSEAEPKYWLLSAHAGWQWQKKDWFFQAEIKYNGLNAPMNLEVLEIEPWRLGKRGALGLYLGVAKRIGKSSLDHSKIHSFDH